MQVTERAGAKQEPCAAAVLWRLGPAKKTRRFRQGTEWGQKDKQRHKETSKGRRGWLRRLRSKHEGELDCRQSKG